MASPGAGRAHPLVLVSALIASATALAGGCADTVDRVHHRHPPTGAEAGAPAASGGSATTAGSGASPANAAGAGGVHDSEPGLAGGAGATEVAGGEGGAGVIVSLA